MASWSESTSFSPSLISGCKLWLDAADSTSMTTSAGKVSQWRDKSGNGNHTTSPGASQYPTLTENGRNNKSVMTFSGSQYLTGSLALGTTFTQYIVYSNATSKIGQGLMDSSDGPVLGKLAYQEGGSLCFQAGYCFRYSTYFNTNNTYRMIMTKCSNPASSATISLWFNGTDQNVATWTFYGANATAISSITVGARGDLICLIGTIAEIVIYDNAISLTDQRQVEGYLAWKWGIQSSLPGSHPNYSVSGYTAAPFPSFALTTTPFKVSFNTPYFSPNTITGCSLWFDGSDSSSLVLSGSNVSAWNDKSGRGYNLTAVSGYANATISSAYQNGLNVVNFSGNGLYRTVANSAVYPQDVFIIVALKSTTAHVDVLGMGPTDTDYFNSLTFSEYTGSRWHNGSSGFSRTPNCVSPTNETSTSFLLIQWSIANNNFLLRRNGSDLVQTSSYTYGLNGGSIFQIGYRHPNVTAANFNGYIGEILVYNTQLGSDQRQQVEGYLAWKWGLQGSLPVGHPNYSVNGYVVAPFPVSAMPSRAFAIQLLPFNVTTTFTYTGADQTYVVPANITRITVYMWAAGGQGTTTINGSFYGGAGAYVEGVLVVTPGETLTIYVGQRGSPGPTFAYKNGGYNSAGDLGTGTAGGRSGIARSSTNIVAVGAGGGGGGNGNGGAGGITSGSAGTGTNPGGGGTQSAGGTAASSSYNSGGVGQNFGGGTGPGAYGGSGGDGYYGGGGGAAFGSGQLGGGGGGGSSLTSNLTSLVTFVSSNGYSAPNTSSPYYTSNIAAGGLGTSGTAGNGLVVILYSN